MSEEQLTWMAVGYLVLTGEITLADNYVNQFASAITKVREEGFKLDGGFIA